LSQDSKTDVAWTCQQLIVTLAHLIDHDGLDRIDTVFAADAVVHLFGQEVRGVASIRELFKARTDGVVIRHVLAPSQIDVLSPNSARAMTYVTVYRGPKTDTPDPLPLTGPVNIVEYEDHFSFVAGGWKINRRDIRMIFRA
jgi:hypothetical protein